MATATRRPRVATPERWQQALARAIAGNVQVRQLSASGAWIATSASDAGTAYELAVTGNVAHGCSCPAGQFDDAVCCHRAMWWHLAGLLDLDPEPEPPAPALVPCDYCFGRGWETVTGKSGTDFRVACRLCDGIGALPVGDEEPPAVACGRCHDTGKIPMTVAGGCAVYPTSVACRACPGVGQVPHPLAA
jgi:hypothetical protein